MRNIGDAASFIADVFGDEAKDVFWAQMDDFLYYVRARALDDMESSLTEVEDQFRNLAQAAILEAASIFLEQNYASDIGITEINVDYDCIYDKDMNVIEPIKRFQSKHDSISKIIVRTAMNTFRRGRQLANKIIERRNAFFRARELDQDTSPKNVNWESLEYLVVRDYDKDPPMERVDIEILRLERKLPHLSVEEGLRLALLYQKNRAMTT